MVCIPLLSLLLVLHTDISVCPRQEEGTVGGHLRVILGPAQD